MEYLCFVRKCTNRFELNFNLLETNVHFTLMKYYPCKLITSGVQNKVSISEKEMS